MIWVFIGIMLACFVAGWLIIMGVDPRKWKGGKRDE